LPRSALKPSYMRRYPGCRLNSLDVTYPVAGRLRRSSWSGCSLWSSCGRR
jgi:hypothetical protein